MGRGNHAANGVALIGLALDFGDEDVERPVERDGWRWDTRFEAEAAFVQGEKRGQGGDTALHGNGGVHQLPFGEEDRAFAACTIDGHAARLARGAEHVQQLGKGPLFETSGQPTSHGDYPLPVPTKELERTPRGVIEVGPGEQFHP